MYRNQGTGRRPHNTYARTLLLSFVGGVADISGLTKSHLDVCNIIEGPFGCLQHHSGVIWMSATPFVGRLDVCNLIQGPF